MQARASQRDRRQQLRHTGYLGPRRRLLVVDNEQTDRYLLVDRLAPLGFELLQARSGEAALALLAAQPADQPVHAIFLDLAMPGIDGWTTLARLRALRLSDAPAAIVSANAFDQGLDNALGITPADFLVKPVRLPLLLGWLQRRLGLAWVDEALPPSIELPAEALRPPPPQALQALDELVRLGYLRGIQKKLDAIDAEHPHSLAFTARLRALASGFQLDTLAQLLQSALAAPDSALKSPADAA